MLYRTVKALSPMDAANLAGLIDGEGTVTLNLMEQDMMAYRHLIRSGAAVEVVEQKAASLRKSLEEAAALSARTELSPQGAFVSAFIIVVREGLEAILVLAAVAAFLIKSGRREGLKHLHAGWIAAPLLGITT